MYTNVDVLLYAHSIDDLHIIHSFLHYERGRATYISGCFLPVCNKSFMRDGYTVSTALFYKLFKVKNIFFKRGSDSRCLHKSRFYYLSDFFYVIQQRN